jgi:peptide/nickel transport system ATP-binding protein/oligopeptide transport system ATP-binding protein
VTASDPVLAVEGLRTFFQQGAETIRAVDGVGFSLGEGETLGIVGESGSGKSLTCLSIMRLIDEPGRIEPESSIRFSGRELTRLSEDEMRRIRGNDISMIFQEPMTSLNPVWTVGDQIAETVRLHREGSKKEATERAIEMLQLVGIPSPAERADSYPHELSGGMRQRAMIAMALACDPSVLIADEPTTALDVTIQAEIIDLLADLKSHLGMSMIFVSHDLGVVSLIADRVLVMYGGQVVEHGPTRRIFEDPRHPYTEGLLRSLPRVNQKLDRLAVIPGDVPDARSWPPGCRFHPRCAFAWDRCASDPPELLERDHASRCWLEREPDRRGARKADESVGDGS